MNKYRKQYMIIEKLINRRLFVYKMKPMNLRHIFRHMLISRPSGLEFKNRRVICIGVQNLGPMWFLILNRVAILGRRFRKIKPSIVRSRMRSRRTCRSKPWNNKLPLSNKIKKKSPGDSPALSIDYTKLIKRTKIN